MNKLKEEIVATRRKFLGLFGAAAAAPAVMGMEQQFRAHGIRVPGLAPANSLGMATPAPSSSSLIKIKDFASYWMKSGEKNARDRASYIDHFDPDIMALRLPLTTKCRMQRDRIYERERVRAEERFMETIKKYGFWEMWE